MKKLKPNAVKTRADTKRMKQTKTKANMFAKEFRLEGKKHVADELKYHSIYKTFKAALKRGQELFGYAMFHVNCGLYVPTREEQLGHSDLAKSTILDTI